MHLIRHQAILSYFAFFNFLLAFVFAVFAFKTQLTFAGVNAWFKPIKFALSIGIYALTMSWLCAFLPQKSLIRVFAWSVVLCLGFEIIYIALQASKGQASHFNLSTPTYSVLYSLMALAAAAISVWTAGIAYLFFKTTLPELTQIELRSIQAGLIFFAIFSLQGFLMGSRLAHTVGAPDGGAGWKFLNWSLQHGDLRISHFLGMHALQILPLLAFTVIQSLGQLYFLVLIYGVVTVGTLLQALAGRPLL